MSNGDRVTGARPEFSGEEGRLLDHLRRLKNNRNGHVAVRLHFSKLNARNRQKIRLEIAAGIFQSRLNAYSFNLYMLDSNDCVVIYREIETRLVDAAVADIWSLFSTDPLLIGDRGEVMNQFVSWYDLASDYDCLLSALQEEAGRVAETTASAKLEEEAAQPMDPAILAVIDERLERVVLGDLVRRQSAVFVDARGVSGRILFREYYLSMADLKQRIAPKINMPGSFWLFLYLTESFDKRMLAIFGRQDFAALTHSVSLNLNISAIYSLEFEHFAKQVGGHADKVVIELQNADVFADLERFERVSDHLQNKGFRVLIDGLSLALLPYCDLSKLGTDMVKFAWSQDWLAYRRNPHMTELSERLQVIADRAVLSRVDSQEAVDFGIELGINCFQGRHVEALLPATDGQKTAGFMEWHG